MIKKLITLGIIGSFLAGGAAIGIANTTNHSKISNQVLLSRTVKSKNNSKISKEAPQPTSFISSYGFNEGYWTFGVSNYADLTSGTAYSNLTVNTPAVGIAGVVNGYGQSNYGKVANKPIGNYQNNPPESSASVPNVPGPNTFQAGLQSYPSDPYVTFYNNVNNGSNVSQQSSYPVGEYN